MLCAAFVWSSQQPREGFVSERAGALSRVAQLVSVLGRGQSRGGASVRLQGLQTAPFESGGPPWTKAPQVGT